MSLLTTAHVLWIEPSDPEERDENECPVCGSENTFITFDRKLVCRKCWTIENLES